MYVWFYGVQNVLIKYYHRILQFKSNMFIGRGPDMTLVHPPPPPHLSEPIFFLNP